MVDLDLDKFCECVHVCVWVWFIYLYCSAQLSMVNIENYDINKIISISNVDMVFVHHHCMSMELGHECQAIIGDILIIVIATVAHVPPPCEFIFTFEGI